MITINNVKYYTARELADQCKVSLETIKRWRLQAGLVGHLIGKRKYVYSEQQIERFIKGE